MKEGEKLLIFSGSLFASYVIYCNLLDSFLSCLRMLLFFKNDFFLKKALLFSENKFYIPGVNDSTLKFCTLLLNRQYSH